MNNTLTSDFSNRAALGRQISRLTIEPVTEHVAREAARLLSSAGPHGHRHAIDALLCATALTAPGPVTILTSDPDDLRKLCGNRATVIRI